MPAPPTLQRTQMILDLAFIRSVSVSARNVKFTTTVYLSQNISCLNITPRIYLDFTAGFCFTSVLEELALEIGVLLSSVVVEFEAILTNIRCLGAFTDVFKTVPTELSYYLNSFSCGVWTRFRVMAPPYVVSPSNSDTLHSVGLLCGRVISPLQRPLPDHTQQSEDYLHVLTQWSRFHLEKLTGSQLIKKSPAFYGTRRFITAFTSVICVYFLTRYLFTVRSC